MLHSRESLDLLCSPNQPRRLVNGYLSLRNINSNHIGAFCSALKQKMQDSGSHFRREYLRLLLDEIVVDGKEVIVGGQYNNLLGAITKKLDAPSVVSSFGLSTAPHKSVSEFDA